LYIRGKEKLLKIYSKDEDCFSLDIQGENFKILLDTVREKPSRYYWKERKRWVLPWLDFSSIVKEARKWGESIKIERKAKEIYQNWILKQKLKMSIKALLSNTNFEVMNIGITKKLRPFQTVGAYFLYVIGSGAIFDPVGLGKSVMALSAVERHYREGTINFCIIVCPSTLKANWATEIEKFTEQQYVLITGNPDQRKKLYKGAYKFFYLIVNYELLTKDKELLEKYIFSKEFRFALITDELQYIKNSRAQRSKDTKKLGKRAVYKIGITATGLELSPLDIWSEFQLINASIFGYNYIHFRDKFLEIDWFGSAIGHKNEKHFSWRLRSFFIRRSRDIIADQLPERIESTYFMELSSEQREFYDNMKMKITSDISDMEKAKKIIMADLLPMIIYLRQCCLSTKLLGHKKNISTKTTELMKFLDTINRSDKTVVFCFFVGMLELLKEQLDESGISNICMHGKNTKSNERISLVEEFNEDSTRVLLTSDILREGVNITSTNHLINFDIHFNPAKMEQRVGRADRITSKHKSINIIHFITKNTIEETLVHDLLESRKRMFTDIIDEGKVEGRITFKKIKSLLEI
jgi:SNF2 family DNA or RNA helicase